MELEFEVFERTQRDIKGIFELNTNSKSYLVYRAKEPGFKMTDLHFYAH